MQNIPQSLLACEPTPVTINIAQLNPDPFNTEGSMQLTTGRIQIEVMTALIFFVSLICGVHRQSCKTLRSHYLVKNPLFHLNQGINVNKQIRK